MVRRPVGSQLLWLVPIMLMLAPLMAGWWTTTSGCDGTTAIPAAYADPPPRTQVPGPSPVQVPDQSAVPETGPSTAPQPADAPATCASANEFGWTAALMTFFLLAVALAALSLFTEIVIRRVAIPEPPEPGPGRPIEPDRSAWRSNPSAESNPGTGQAPPQQAPPITARRRALAVYIDAARMNAEIRALLDALQGQGVARTHIDESGGYAEYGDVVLWVDPADRAGAFAAPGDPVVLVLNHRQSMSSEREYGQ